MTPRHSRPHAQQGAQPAMQGRGYRWRGSEGTCNHSCRPHPAPHIAGKHSSAEHTDQVATALGMAKPPGLTGWKTRFAKTGFRFMMHLLHFKSATQTLPP